ncbi:Uncharacterised protein [Mycobacteroides abscessus]|nr:Uncharacterised protein [Mycobacteroides abscessus]
MRRQHHRHVAAVLLRGCLHEAVVGDVRAEPLQQPVAQFGPGLLASAEHDRDLDFGSGFQEADHVALLGFVVVIVDLGPKLLFLDDGLLLILARLTRFLGRLVLELAVVHDLADRRPGIWGYLDKVEIGVGCDAERIFDPHDADLLAFRADQADFGYADTFIDAGLSADVASLARPLTVVTEARFDGDKSGPISKKALHMAGPEADRSRRETPFCVAQNTHPKVAGPDRCTLWPAVGAGLHLMSPTESETVAHDSLAAVTDDLDHDQYDRDQYNQSPAESVRELADIPAIEVITKAIVMLMSSSAEKLGLSSADPDESPHRDLDEARRLITALAGLVAASVEYLGPHAAPIRDGLQSLQKAFREASAVPDEPGQGPGERYLR